MYYFDDSQIFNSKIDALEYSLKVKKPFKLYYYDDIFSLIDWTIEPPMNLEYYYIQQALRIRDHYDKIILCYSGGYDSTNILETFYYNNIPLDKIVLVGAFSQDSIVGTDNNHNGELYHNAFPYIKTLGLENITQIYDYTKLFNNINNFSISSYGENWVDIIGTRLSPHNWFWRDISKYIIPTNWSNKKVAIIFGKDKPKLYSFNNNLGFYFIDTVINNYGNPISNENYNYINFYWDPEYPYILIKQLHILKNLYNNGFDITNTDNIIYNLKVTLKFKSSKSSLTYLSLRDNFILSHKNSNIYKFYLNGLKYLNKKVGLQNKVVYSKFYNV